MSKYKCVIFDCDGVLVDSEPIANQVMVDMANELGANINLDYALKHFKGASIQRCQEQIAELVTERLPDNFLPDFRARSFESFKNNMKPVVGITDVLDGLALPFCVASSGPENKIRLNLELTGLLPHFEENIFSCFTIKKWKPDPAVFLWAAETMGFQPEDCVVIEDSLTGVTAAKNGGFDVFGFTAHDYHNELEGQATLTFNNMAQLLRLIG
ncbi:HAD family hydrolase [Gelidibacter salicanalis]|uniref:HAD family hydrolase n=1 Tax=Gelidibacter salicanalis TaxID=291193 RepID=A0A934KSQ8_9FLAO|nr:HAD family hydrolase [Gelidibacter salicanalis]MBJ7882894.1 HAD family hydrolase [Gelidibacter salicanalis]